MSISRISLNLSQISDNYWSLSTETLLEKLQTSLEGLSNNEYEARLGFFGYNRLKPKKDSNKILKFFLQFP